MSVLHNEQSKIMSIFTSTVQQNAQLFYTFISQQMSTVYHYVVMDGIKTLC